MTARGSSPPITVAVLALDDVVPFDFAIPCGAFSWTRLADGGPGYDVRVCGPRKGGSVAAEGAMFRIGTPYGLEGLADASTVVVPGLAPNARPLPASAVAALRRAAARGARIASICSGAFILAEAGLLDGRRATTHWAGTAELARRYPSVRVDRDTLFVDDGSVLTSAGAAAGLDLCLHMIRTDHGAAVAADVARSLVMPLERDGGQSQFVAHDPPPAADASLAPLLAWIDRHLADELSVDDLAEREHVSARTLTRRFREQTATTPLQYLLRARVRRAQELLEATDDSVEGIARRCGFASATAFRERFRRVVGVSPQRYRATFRGESAGSDTVSAVGRIG